MQIYIYFDIPHFILGALLFTSEQVEKHYSELQSFKHNVYLLSNFQINRDFFPLKRVFH